MSQLKLAVMLLLILLFGSGISKTRATSCECYASSVCQSYTKAEAVFTGKLMGFKRRDNSPKTVTASFEPLETFKGQTSALEEVEFAVTCGVRELTSGATYFVYKFSGDLPESWCDRSDLLERVPLDLEYARRQSKSKPQFSIGGHVDGLTKDQLKEVCITVSYKNLITTVTLDEQGSFNHVGSGPGQYRVNIRLPFEATIFVDSAGALYREQSRTLEYNITSAERGCDYRKIQITKVD